MAHAVLRDVHSPTAASCAAWVRLRPRPRPPCLVLARGEVVDVYEPRALGDGRLAWVASLPCEGVPASLAEVPLPAAAFAVAMAGSSGGDGEAGRAVAVGFAGGRVRLLALHPSTLRLVQVASFNFEWDAVGAGAFLRAPCTTLRQSGVAGRGLVVGDPAGRALATPVYDSVIAVAMPLARDGGSCAALATSAWPPQGLGSCSPAAGTGAADRPEVAARMFPLPPLTGRVGVAVRGLGADDVAAANAATLSLFAPPALIHLCDVPVPVPQVRGISGTIIDAAFLHGHDAHAVLAVVVARAPAHPLRADALAHTVTVAAVGLPQADGGVTANDADGIPLDAAAWSAKRPPASVLWEVDRLPSDALYCVPAPAPVGGLLLVTANAIFHLSQHGHVGLATNAAAVASVDARDHRLYTNGLFDPTAPPLAMNMAGSRAAFMAADTAWLACSDGSCWVLHLHGEPGGPPGAVHHLVLLPTATALPSPSALVLLPVDVPTAGLTPALSAVHGPRPCAGVLFAASPCAPSPLLLASAGRPRTADEAPREAAQAAGGGGDAGGGDAAAVAALDDDDAFLYGGAAPAPAPSSEGGSAAEHGATSLGLAGHAVVLDVLPTGGCGGGVAMGREARLVDDDEGWPSSAPPAELVHVSGTGRNASVTTLHRFLRLRVAADVKGLAGVSGSWFVPHLGQEDGGAPSGTLILSQGDRGVRIFTIADGLVERDAAESQLLAAVGGLDDAVLGCLALAPPGQGWLFGWAAADDGGRPVGDALAGDGDGGAPMDFDDLLASTGDDVDMIPPAYGSSLAAAAMVEARRTLRAAVSAPARAKMREAHLGALRAAAALADSHLQPPPRQPAALAIVATTRHLLLAALEDASQRVMAAWSCTDLACPPGVSFLSVHAAANIVLARCSDGHVRCGVVVLPPAESEEEGAAPELKPLAMCTTAALQEAASHSPAPLAHDPVTAATMFADADGDLWGILGPNDDASAADGSGGGLGIAPLAFALLAHRSGIVRLHVLPSWAPVWEAAGGAHGDAIVADGDGLVDGGLSSLPPPAPGTRPRLPRSYLVEVGLAAHEGRFHVACVDQDGSVCAYAWQRGESVLAAPARQDAAGVAALLSSMAGGTRAVGAVAAADLPGVLGVLEDAAVHELPRWVRVDGVGWLQTRVRVADTGHGREAAHLHPRRCCAALVPFWDVGGWAGWLVATEQPVWLLHHRGSLLALPAAVTDLRGAAEGAGPTYLPGDMAFTPHPVVAATPIHAASCRQGMLWVTSAAAGGGALHLGTLPPPALPSLTSLQQDGAPALLAAGAAARAAWRGVGVGMGVGSTAAAADRREESSDGVALDEGAPPPVSQLWDEAATRSLLTRAAAQGAGMDALLGAPAMAGIRRPLPTTPHDVVYLPEASNAAGVQPLQAWLKAAQAADRAAGRPVRTPMAPQLKSCIQPLYAVVSSTPQPRNHAADVDAERARHTVAGSDAALPVAPDHQELLSARLIEAHEASAAAAAAASAGSGAAIAADGLAPGAAAAALTTLMAPGLADQQQHIDLVLGTVPEHPAVSWTVVDTFHLRPMERVLCAREALLSDAATGGKSVPTLLVGTALLHHRADDVRCAGRILLLRLAPNPAPATPLPPPLTALRWQLVGAAEQDSPVASVECIRPAGVPPRIVAGVGKTLHVFAWTRAPASVPAPAAGDTPPPMGTLDSIAFRECAAWVSGLAAHVSSGIIFYADAYTMLRVCQWREADRNLIPIATVPHHTSLRRVDIMAFGKLACALLTDDDGNATLLTEVGTLVPRVDWWLRAPPVGVVHSRCAFPLQTPALERTRDLLLVAGADGRVTACLPAPAETVAELASPAAAAAGTGAPALDAGWRRHSPPAPPPFRAVFNHAGSGSGAGWSGGSGGMSGAGPVVVGGVETTWIQRRVAAGAGCAALIATDAAVGVV